MSTKQAKTLTDEDIEDVLHYIRQYSRYKVRDTLFVLLTCRLGLRAQEVARMHLADFTTARGEIGDQVFVSSRGAKYGRSRKLPMRRDVFKGLTDYLNVYPIKAGALFHDQYGEEISPNAVAQQLARIYAKVGLVGCSSHSGRRTFGTRVAQAEARYGGTLKDTQELLGHRNITTTAVYVEFTNHQVDLVNSI